MKRFYSFFAIIAMFAFAACEEPGDNEVNPNDKPNTDEQITGNEIWYTSADGAVVTPNAADVFGADVVSNTYKRGKGVIAFDGEVTAIGQSAFADCTGLVSITIPESVTLIGEGAFAGCSALADITIPESVTEIGHYAFRNCSGLQKIHIPDSVEFLGVQVLSHCSGLQEVYISKNLMAWGYSMFLGSAGSYIKYDGCMPDFTYHEGGLFYGSLFASIELAEGIESVGSYAFDSCESLTNVIIPNSVTYIGLYAFRGCTGLTNITIPKNVTWINDYAFQGCTGITSITIPDKITRIGEQAFYECTSLKEVYCQPTTPPKGTLDAFNSNADGRKIYVPTESVEAYKSADNWSAYADDIVGYEF